MVVQLSLGRPLQLAGLVSVLQAILKQTITCRHPTNPETTSFGESQVHGVGAWRGWECQQRDVALAGCFSLCAPSTSLDLYANVIHCKSLPGVVTRHRDIDILIVRENTEGEYSSLEHEVGACCRARARLGRWSGRPCPRGTSC